MALRLFLAWLHLLLRRHLLGLTLVLSYLYCPFTWSVLLLWRVILSGEERVSRCFEFGWRVGQQLRDGEETSVLSYTSLGPRWWLVLTAPGQDSPTLFCKISVKNQYITARGRPNRNYGFSSKTEALAFVAGLLLEVALLEPQPPFN